MEPAIPEHFHAYNSRLRDKAYTLRNTMTKAEACLWKYALKAGMRKGYKFKKQRPVLNYIADFMCQELMLIIEVDGISHTWEITVAKDTRKQKDLEAAGFTILRFTDEEVLTGINAVIREIDYWIDSRS